MVKTNAIIALVLVAILVGGGLFLFFPEETGTTGATATIYIQNADSGEVMAAEMDISKLAFHEAMLLSAYGEVREADFKPLDFTSQVSALSWGGTYNVWVVTKVKVTATDDIASLTKLRCSWGGKPGMTGGSISVAPDHVTNTASTAALVSIGGSVGPESENTNVAFGTEYTFDQSGVAGGKFNMWKVYDSSTSRYVFNNLNGNTIDGATITCTITAYGVDDSGASIGNSQSATMKINVNSWSQSGLSIVITGMTSGNAAV